MRKSPLRCYKTPLKEPHRFQITQALLLLLLLILAQTNHSFPIFKFTEMEEAQKSSESLVVQMRRKLSLYDLDRKVHLSAVFFADKIPNKVTICNTMKTVLSRFGKTGVTASNERDPNDRMFSVTAEDAESAMAILNGSPWSIMRYSVHFQEWPESLAIEELQCNQIAFWVQIRGVPPYMFDVENVREMVDNFGEFIKMDDPLEGEEGTYSFLRVRILLDARDPLPTGYELPRENGTKKWVSFAYEKLSDFCYVCGRLGHTDLPRTPCPHGANPENENEYGDWLRALPPRRQIRNDHSQVKTASGRNRRRFPGQTIQPVESKDNCQESQPQGASSSHISELHPQHSTPSALLQLSDTGAQASTVNHCDSNNTKALLRASSPGLFLPGHHVKRRLGGRISDCSSFHRSWGKTTGGGPGHHLGHHGD